MPKTLDQSFIGSPELVKVFINSTTNLSKSYNNGLSFMLAGMHGTGKSLTVINILKKATHKNFTALYTTLNDIVAALTISSNEHKFLARKELTEVDFLVVDEVDQRFVATELASDLFGRNLEHILRTRIQNKLPIMMVSNSPNPLETFNGSLKVSLESLMSKIPLIPIIGEDIRKMQAGAK